VFDEMAGNAQQLSRRAWLGVAGSTAVLAAPALKSISSATTGRAEVRHGNGWVAFSVRGVERWRIETRRFSGSPRITFSRTEHEIHVSLAGARYPGTELPADFECTVRPGFLSSSLSIRFALGELEGTCPFEQWLLGYDTLELSGPGSPARVDLSPGIHLDLEDPYVGTFEPSWVLRLSTEGFALLTGLEEPLRGDTVQIMLPQAGEASLLQHTPERRTLLVMERTEGQWDCPPDFKGESFAIVSIGSGFDTIRVETAETSRGERKSALLAEAVHGDQAFAVQFPASLKALSGKNFALPLVAPRYVLAFSGLETDRALVARYPDTPAWFSADGASFGIGNGPAARPLEIHARGREISSAICEPELLSILLPLQGALVDPNAPSGASRLTLLAEGVQEKKAAAVQQQINPAPAVAQVALTNPKVSAIRPEDLLKIDFEFRGFTIANAGGSWSLARKGDTGYIIAEFPPQNIGEQAFFEATTPAGSEAPTEPPVKSRLSGPSRLVFRVPSTVTSIPYTLESILQACLDADLTVSFPAARLTSKQSAFLASLQKAASATSSSLNSTKSAASSLKGISGTGKAPALGQRSAILSSAGTLRSSQVSLRSGLETLEIPRIVQKRLETMQNLIARDAQTGDKSLAAHTEMLAKVVDGLETSGIVTGASGLIIVPAVTIIPVPANPGPLETSIEAPFRLIVSPNSYGAWAHAVKPVTYNGRTELWHTRLGVRWGKGKINENSALLRTMRAVWSPDYQTSMTGPGDPSGSYGTNDNPFRMSLNRQDRHEIVHLTSNFKIASYTPLPVDVDRFMMSSLGAWMNVHGFWGDIPPVPLSVQSWRHRATMGRDSYVRVVYAGFLYPFGHRASLIKITERKFQKSPSGKVVAYLRQRLYIVVRQQVREYPASGQSNDARGNPFRSIRVTTLITPNLDNPGSGVQSQGESAFWPYVASKPFQFHMVGEDWEGRSIDFTTPVIFMKQGVAVNPVLNGITTDYGKVIDERRQRPMSGQKIAFADSTVPGDTTYETDSVTWGVELATTDWGALVTAGGAPFYPLFDSAAVNLKSVERMTGGPGKQKIEFHDGYLNGGFDTANKGEVFAKLAEAVQSDFSKDSSKSGGLLAPNAAITGLSRSIGSVAGKLDEMAAGTFDPVSFFEAALSMAKLFGCIPLTAILSKIMDFKGLLDRIPLMVSEESPGVYITKYVWYPKIQQSIGELTDGTILDGIFVPHKPDDGAVVTVMMRTPLTGEAPSVTVTAELLSFDLHLIPEIQEFMVVKIEKIGLKLGTGNKPDVEAKMGGIDFVGPLSFVQVLRKYIPFDGFSDPPFLNVDASGITAGFSIPLPNIAIGVFNLSNISLGAGLDIPFIGGSLAIRFAFCERENPFVLTISMFGGGGFFGVTLTPAGLAVLEAAFEFGGALAFDIGVASGGVHVMAGIYYKKTGHESTLEGYFRLGGSLEILGIITLSIEFYLSLTYQSNGKVFGQATVKVKIEILFFSVGVTLHTERQLKGSAGDPLFAELMAPQDWNEYLAAFA
jgi:hypothetical protein